MKGKDRSWENIAEVISVIGMKVWAGMVAVEEMRRGWILLYFAGAANIMCS